MPSWSSRHRCSAPMIPPGNSACACVLSHHPACNGRPHAPPALPSSLQASLRGPPSGRRRRGLFWWMVPCPADLHGSAICRCPGAGGSGVEAGGLSSSPRSLLKGRIALRQAVAGAFFWSGVHPDFWPFLCWTGGCDRNMTKILVISIVYGGCDGSLRAARA
jgi:hypothetical protein